MILRQVRYLMDPWAAKGGPASRRNTRQRAEAFARWCRAQGLRDLRQVGRRQMVAYLRELEASGLAPSTVRRHWHAIRQLFLLAGRPEPPRYVPEAQKRNERRPPALEPRGEREGGTPSRI